MYLLFQNTTSLKIFKNFGILILKTLFLRSAMEAVSSHL